MAIEQFGPLAVQGTQAQIDLIRPTARQIEATIGALPSLEPAICKFVPLDTMPYYANGAGRARGLYRDGPHVLKLADSDDYPVERTFGHELIHWVQADCFTRWHRRSCARLVFAKATGEPAQGYGDVEIDGRLDYYRNSIAEAIAVYGSAAVFGYTKPAFTSIYGWKVREVDWPELRSIVLFPGD